MREIYPPDIHLWLCRTGDVANSRSWLCELLSQYAHVAPGDWAFEEIGEGKPRLLPGQAALDFNLSHSAGWLACAITAGQAVGVDIEWDNPRREVMRLAQRFFNPREVADLAACDDAQRRRLFYDLWTLKESTVKSRAGAVAPLLEALSFKVEYGCGPAVVVPDFDGHPASYCLLRPEPDYHLALCLPGQVALSAPRVFGFAEGRHAVEIGLLPTGLSIPADL